MPDPTSPQEGNAINRDMHRRRVSVDHPEGFCFPYYMIEWRTASMSNQQQLFSTDQDEAQDLFLNLSSRLEVEHANLFLIIPGEENVLVTCF